MRTRVWVVALLAVLCLVGSILPATPESASDQQVLILYDSGGDYGWIGGLHAQMLANLLGHFPLDSTSSPVQNYRAGDINRHRATFYIGSTYDNALPTAFLRDVMASTKPVCWFKYNIWRLAWGNGEFADRFGFTFNWLDWSGYDTIRYKGESFTKAEADRELGLVWVLNDGVCTEIASASRTTRGGDEHCVPYIVRGANLWYVADLPFSYISEEDRYIVFCDVLHDIVGIDHAESKRAIIRIEDVDPTADPAVLREIADFLHGQAVPFAVAVVPVYYDPLGHYNAGIPEHLRLSSKPEVVKALRYMVEKGGRIVLHGYTHQYDEIPNPYNGVTGDDFEFYRVELAADDPCRAIYRGPVSGDPERHARGRVAAGRAELRACGLSAVAWETPHYAASALEYTVFASQFSLTIQRVLYSDLPARAEGPGDSGKRSAYGGQFFPYVIQRDIYGQKVVPENLGNVEPYPWECYEVRLPADILRAAEKNRAVRDGWASCYFHHFYDMSYLREVVRGIQDLGYTFVPLGPDLK